MRKSTLFIWLVRVLSIAVALFGLPFYFGYGNPLPFIDPVYTAYDNLWLTIFPFVFIGLAVGVKDPLVGGLLIVVLITCGSIISIIMGMGLAWSMLVPLALGICNLLLWYSKQRNNE
jgi:hypothetical protein